MKVQAAALLLGLATCFSASAAEPVPAPPPGDEARWKAAEALTQEQILASTDRAALSKLAELYNGRDFERFSATLQRLVGLTPDSGELKLQLASLYASRDMKSQSYDTLMRMQLQGFGFDLNPDPRFEKVHGTQVWKYIVENLLANAKPFGDGKVDFKLPKGDRLLESLDYDSKRQKFVVGSARDGAVYLADKSGRLEDLVAPDAKSGLWSILDLRVDMEHDALWVLSNGLAVFKGYDAGMVGKAYLMHYQLSTGKFVAKYAAPEEVGGHVLTAIALGKGGRVYVADGLRREIFKLDGDALKLLTGNPKLSSIKALTVSGDGNTLYFADQTLGLFGIDLTTSKPFALAHNPERLAVGGIESMFWYDGTLVIVQPQMVPQRVMRLKLTADGHAIESAIPLDVANAEFVWPTGGAVVGNDLYFVSNGQKSLYDSYGVLKAADQLEAPEIFKTNMRYAWGQPGISAAMADPNAKPGDKSPLPLGTTKIEKTPEAAKKDGDKKS
jgi:hypothetical protein